MKTIRVGNGFVAVRNDLHARLKAKAEKQGKSIAEVWALEHSSVSEVKESRLEKEDTSRKEDRRLAPYVGHKDEDFLSCPEGTMRRFDPFLGVHWCGLHMRCKVTDRTIMASMVNPEHCKDCIEIRREQAAQRQREREEKAQQRELNIRGKAQVDMYSVNHSEHDFITYLSAHER